MAGNKRIAILQKARQTLMDEFGIDLSKTNELHTIFTHSMKVIEVKPFSK